MPTLIINAAYYLWLGLQTVGIAISQATAIFIVKSIAVIGASMATSKLLAPKMPSMADSLGSRGQMTRSPISARQIIYGRAKVAGSIVYLSTTGAKNEYLHMVLAIAGHEVEELGDVYFNEDVALTGAGDGNATGKYAGYAEIYKKLGASGQTAFSTLVTDTASLADGKWTNDHKLTGIACIYVRLKWSTEVFVGGIPNVTVVVKGKKVYDPRTTTTAYSTNSALCLRDYLTSSLGMGMSAGEIDDTACIVAANVCDEQVQILPLSPATYENRYETNGIISTSESPDAAIAKLLSAMAGLSAYSSGQVVMYAGTYQIPTLTLTEKHFVGPLSVTTRTSARDRVNTVKGVYVSEENQWQPSDFPVITSATYVTQDNGTKYTRDVSLPFTISPSCAQRLAVIELRRARQEIVLTARFRLEAMQLRAGETVMISNTKLGWTNKVFEVMEWRFVADGQPPQLAVDMTLREIDSTVYSWTVSDEIAVADAPNTTLPNPFVVTAPTGLTLVADGTTQQYQADGTALPRIKVSWSAPSEEFVQSGGFVGIEYKETTATTYLTWGRLPGDQTLDYISSDVRIGTGYNVRIYSESYFKVSSSYVSGVVTVAQDTVAPSIPTSLTANIGTGKAVSLDWDDVTAADLSEYGVYRNTTGVTPASATVSKIAETRSSRFFDAEVAIGTTYYYWVNAYDRLENVSGFSNRAEARPLGVTASPDLTPPSTPSAPTFKSERVYESSDGNIFAAIVITVPAVPSGGVALDVLSRITGADGYKLEGQIDSATATAFEIDDLTPGQSYDFVCRGVNSSGIYSALSTALTRTAPSDTIAPNTPTGVAAFVGTGRAVSLSWTAVTATDIWEYGIYRNTTSTTPATTATNKIAEVDSTRFFDADVTIGTTYYYWVAAIDTSENYSGFSTRVQAIPSVITAGPVDNTPPSTPSAPTFVSQAVYLSKDGTTFVRVTLNAPALPTGGVSLDVLYRRSGASEWIIGNQITATGNVSIDDLTPGEAYQFATRAVSFSGILSAVSSTLSYTTTGDTTAPATPTGLVATIGTGRSVSLDWADNTETDFAEYGVYRNTTSTTPASTATDKIAETRASRFVDTEVISGTTYYYWVNAYDRSENVSGFSSRVQATPIVISSGEIDSTAPSNPTALTSITNSIYLASDGGARSLVVVTVAALPANARLQNVLYRKQGSATAYEVAAQLANSGAVSAVIDDLTPGVTYDIASQAWSFTNIASAVVTAAFSPFVSALPAAPANPTGGNLSGDGVKPKYFPGTEVFLFGTRVGWSPNTEKDFAYYEIKATTTDSDSATNYSWTPYDGVNSFIQTRDNECFLYNATLGAGYVRIRAVNRAGVASGWVSLGNANSVGNASIGTGSMAGQNFNDVDITGGKVKIPITVAGTQYRGFEANETTAVDVYAVNLRVYDSTTTQKLRVDNATGDVYVQSSKVLSTRYATTPTTLDEVISALQHHGLVP